MNYLKVASITNLQQGRKEFEKRFVQNQSQVNNLIKHNHRVYYNYNEAQEVLGISRAYVSEGKKVKFGEYEENCKIQGKILEQQLKLKSLESEYDLKKSRIEDANNAKTFRVHYPYGKQNLRITQDVLEKYKSGNQSQMLKKFEQQAKKIKKYKKSQKRLEIQAQQNAYFHKNNQGIIQREPDLKEKPILQKQKKKLQRVNEIFLKENSRSIKKKENKSNMHIESMLKDMSDKMDQNFSLLLENQKQDERNKRFVREVDITRARLQKIRAVDRLQATERYKLPVVVYKNSRGKQQNFINRSVCLDLIDHERRSHFYKPEQFQKVLNIYNANKLRLDKLCQRISLRTDNGSAIFY